MKLGMSEHEIMCGVAHLRAVQQQSDVFGIGVLAAFLETVVNLMKTGIVAVFAVMDAIVHLRAHVFVDVGHVGPLVGFASVDDR
jgi:hypothetical protein